jgi:hypothetical protein
MIVKCGCIDPVDGNGEEKGQGLAEEVNRLNNPCWNRLDSGVHIHQY